MLEFTIQIHLIGFLENGLVTSIEDIYLAGIFCALFVLGFIFIVSSFTLSLCNSFSNHRHCLKESLTVARNIYDASVKQKESNRKNEGSKHIGRFRIAGSMAELNLFHSGKDNN